MHGRAHSLVIPFESQTGQKTISICIEVTGMFLESQGTTNYH